MCPSSKYVWDDSQPYISTGQEHGKPDQLFFSPLTGYQSNVWKKLTDF